MLEILAGGCLTDNNMGAPTQEGSLFRPYISLIGAVCAKEDKTFRLI